MPKESFLNLELVGKVGIEGNMTLRFFPENIEGGTNYGGRQWYVQAKEEENNKDVYSTEFSIETSTMVAFCKAMLAYCEILEKEDKKQFM